MPPTRTMTGTIKTLKQDKGFGFIRAKNAEYFFHAQDLRGVEFTQLQVHDTVTFIPTDGRKGPRAENVELSLDAQAEA